MLLQNFFKTVLTDFLFFYFSGLLKPFMNNSTSFPISVAHASYELSS